MRLWTRFVLIGLLLALTAGPVLAAPLSFSTGAVSPAPARSSPLRSLAATIAYGLGLAAFGITIRKDTASMAKKFVRNAGAAAGDYKDGVAGAGGEWETRTREGNDAWKAGVQEAIGQDRFAKNVAGSGGKYQENAVKLGAPRYPQGIQNAENAWQQGTQPYLDALKGLTLPPPGPRRSPQNMQRAEAVARTLGMMKIGR